MLNKAALVGCLLAILGSAPACAQCEWLLIEMAVDEANTAIRRIKGATSLEDAQNYARRLQPAMEEASVQIAMCECHFVQSEFDDPKTCSRRARNASDRDDFVYQMNRAIRSFSATIDAINMRAC